VIRPQADALDLAVDLEELLIGWWSVASDSDLAMLRPNLGHQRSEVRLDLGQRRTVLV
jgi:hypothetical protein